MHGWRQWAGYLVILTLLAGCASTSKSPSRTKKGSYQSSRTVAPVRIMHLSQTAGAQELMLHSMSLVGTPYRYGGSSRDTGFDCSGMVQYLYKNALGVSLPRTARDMAAAGIKIDKNRLRVGDLVFFNTSGNAYSHVGLYIGNDQFIHSPNSRSVIRTNTLNDSYYSRRFDGARTYFVY